MSAPGSTPETFAALVRAQWEDHRADGLRWDGGSLTHHGAAAAAAARAALLGDLLPRGAEPHVGLLLDNTPEYPLWLAAAALAGVTAVGLNTTRRGAELARDITHTECALLVTGAALLPLLDGLDLPVLAPGRLLVTDEPGYTALLRPYEGAKPGEVTVHPPEPGGRMLLTFTSGSTGAPKAVIVTQGRLAGAGRALARNFAVRRADVHYLCMPMFHGNAVLAGWAPALAGGAGVALARRFSASRFLPEVRAYGATYFTYVGRAIQYLLATPERDDDADNPLRLGFGTEAGPVDAARFTARFATPLVEGYGSSEGGAAIQHSDGAPPGAVGRPAPGADLAVVDPETGAERTRARRTADGTLTGVDAAIGELVNRGPSLFEGYWKNAAAEAARTARGWYWTGDLFFRDEEGWFHFAGRTDDRLRVDGENLAAAVIEHLLARCPGVTSAAVYAVPDPVSGDQVMAALALERQRPFDPEEFAAFLAAQPDLSTKSAPRFVRVLPALPVTATNKIDRAALRRTGFLGGGEGGEEGEGDREGEVWWRPFAAGSATPTDATSAGATSTDATSAGATRAYRRLTPDDTRALLAEYAAHRRTHLLPPPPPPPPQQQQSPPSPHPPRRSM
ncbi:MULTISPECIES: AMP-binding protein [unclassified Streptomyces]|uniref:AMP-binding protein n=1 Tax=unclassified Streptomyces TaxID=2593676 RepID=UPI002DD81365|nr:AMP-binding protein [Streptomyces sp. NBC_01775]WSB78945.1 AMP-binding protein [Streptomyces sp. NBC_01775]WSS41637.1 AMP-binding protein [Streptomyces sp. NBC_01187]